MALTKKAALGFSSRRRGVLERWIWSCSWRFTPQHTPNRTDRWPALRKGSGRWICSQTVGKSLANFTCSGSRCDWIKQQWKKGEGKTITDNGAQGFERLWGKGDGKNAHLLKDLPQFFSLRKSKTCQVNLYILPGAIRDRVDGFIIFFWFRILIGNSWSPVCQDLRHDVWPSCALLLIISKRQHRVHFDLLLLKKNGAVCHLTFIWLMLSCLHTSGFKLTRTHGPQIEGLGH